MILNPFISIMAPIIGCIISGLFGRFFGRGTTVITTSCLILAGLNAWYLFFRIMGGYQFFMNLCNWFPFVIQNNWSFLVDSIASVMFVVVLTVSALVHLYSIKYMEQDPHLVRFMVYLSLFTVFMLLLVTGGNLLILFVGWEGVGLCSYLLISFWYTRLQANKAALKAMVVNRIGDISFIAASSLTIFFMGSLNSSIMSTSIDFFLNDASWLLTFSGILFLLAAVGKSAQLGLHTWLPDAMEGPTPVSALIHAATMVTAGVFLLIRVSPWLYQSKIALILTLIIGALTTIFAGTVGILQFDIKRVIAYSTCSQLGYMILICGGAIFSLGLFHLFNHAFFKALLFLGAGSIIHASGDEQDMRRYGLVSLFSPFLCIIFFIASLALMGVPFLSGFFSKDGILETLISVNSIYSLWGYLMGVIAALFTVAYSFKISYWSFFSSTAFDFKYFIKNWHNVSAIEIVVLFILLVFSLGSGFLFKDHFVGFGGSFFGNNVKSVNHLLVDGEFLPIWLKLIPIFGIIIILSLSFYISRKVLFGFDLSRSQIFYFNIFNFLSHKWYFNLVQNLLVSRLILNFGYESFWIWDRWILEQIRFKTV